ATRFASARLQLTLVGFMSPRRALALGVVLLVVAAVWLAERNVHRAEGAVTVSAAEPDTATGSTPATLRFFRNPAPAKPFTVRTIDDREMSLDAFKGKVTIVNFWATWCPPCRAEIPDLIALQEKYRDHLQVIGISQDEDGPAVVRKYVADHGMNYP